MKSFLFSERPQFDDPDSIDEEFVRRVRQSYLDREESEAREHLRLQDLTNFDPEELSGSDTGMCYKAVLYSYPILPAFITPRT